MDTPVAQPSAPPSTSPPIQIPTRGGSRAATDPSAPGVNPSSTFGWLRELMARKPAIEPSPQTNPRARMKPSRSDLSAASPSMFVGATSRRESGQLQSLSMGPRSETSLINPSTSTLSVPVPSTATEFPFPNELSNEAENRLPTTNTGVSIPTSATSIPTANTGLSVLTTAIPSLPSRASIATSSGCSTTRDPDETVSLTYFSRQPRRFRSDADVVHASEGSVVHSDDEVEADAEGLDEGPIVDDQPAAEYDIYDDELFRDSLSVLALDIERNRAIRRQEAREEARRNEATRDEDQMEEDERGAARAREAARAAHARQHNSQARNNELPEPPGNKKLHFQEPLLPVFIPSSKPTAPEPMKWTKGLTRGLSRLFGREARNTPDLELGEQWIPYAQKGKQRAEPPTTFTIPPPLGHPRSRPPRVQSPNIFKRFKSRPIPRESFSDMSSDHGSPFQLPTMPSVSGITRKLSFRRQPSPKSWLDMGPDPFAKEPIRIEPSRLSNVLGAATRAMTIKKRREPMPAIVYDPRLSKAERILGADLSTYKSTQSYPDLLMPIPRHPQPQYSTNDLRNSRNRPATSSGLRSVLQPAGFDFQPRPTSFAGNHPFYTAGLPPPTEARRESKGPARPITADGTRRPAWALPEKRPLSNCNTSDRRASVGSRAESIANRLERMVSNSSSQLEPDPAQTQHPGQLEPRTTQQRLYPGGIDPVADPELYAVVTRFELHRRAEDERRASEDHELQISATSFPMPPTPRQVPVRRSSLPRQPAPIAPALLSPSAMPRPWRTPSPASSLPVVQEHPVKGSKLELRRELSKSTAPSHAAAAHTTTPARVESSPGVLAGYDPLSPVHPSPAPIATPNVLGLSTAPSTATTGSRVSFAPSPPRHSHVDLKEFLMTSPSQIIRTTSAAEFRRPTPNGPLIPEYPASYTELVPFILCESDIWRRQDQEHSSSDEPDDLWPPSTPQYTWKQYRMVLTSARKELHMSRSYEIPADLESKVCIHLFKIQPRKRPATAPGPKFVSLVNYDPEVTRRNVSGNTGISTFQPYVVDTGGYRRGHWWKDEDAEVDVTAIYDVVDGRKEHSWYLSLPSLEAYKVWANVVGTERDCLIAGTLGCGIAFRNQLARSSHNPTSRRQLLAQEIAAANARWSTRRLALPNDTPPASPIRPAPRLPPRQPSKGILKRRTSTGDITDGPMIAPWSDMQGYIDGLTAFVTAYDVEREEREEKYRKLGIFDRLPRKRTETDQTVRPVGTAGEASTSQTRPDATGTSSQGLAPSLEPTPALSDISLPSTDDIASPPNVLTILPRRRRPKSASDRKPPPPDSPGTTRSHHSPENEEYNEALSDCVNDCLATYPSFGDPVDVDQAPLPDSPTIPIWSNDRVNPLHKPTSPYNVAGPSTVLAAHYNHMPITVDHDPPVHGPKWPMYAPMDAVLGVNLSEETIGLLSDSSRAKSIRAIDKLRAVKAQREMRKAGGAWAGGVNTAEVFGFVEPTEWQEAVAAVEAAEGDEVDAGEDEGLILPDARTLLDVPVDNTDAKVKEKGQGKVMDKGKGKENQSMDKGKKRLISRKKVNVWQETATTETVKKELERKETVKKETESKGKGKHTSDESLKIPQTIGYSADFAPVTPKINRSGSSIHSVHSTRSTHSTQSIHITQSIHGTRSTTRAYRAVSGNSLPPAGSLSEPTPTYVSPSQRPQSLVHRPDCGNSDLQPIRNSQLGLGSTPSIPQSTSRTLTFDDTPDHSEVITPFTKQCTLERPAVEETPTHRTARANAIQVGMELEKRGSNEEVVESKVVGKIEDWGKVVAESGGGGDVFGPER